MSIRADFDISEISRLSRLYPDVAKEEIENALDIVVSRVSSEIAAATPAGVGGAAGLRGSIFGEVRTMGSTITGTVGTPVEYGIVVEMGRKPGKFPPIAPIELWVRRILGVPAGQARGVAFVVARKIAEHGTEGAWMFRDTWERLEPWARGVMDNIPANIIRRVTSGT